MIIDKNIDLVCCQSNKKTLNKIFNEKLIIGKHYIFPTEKLSKGCCIKIKIKCDFCDYTGHLSYGDYLNRIKKDNKYYCRKCSHIKNKLTCKEKYGDENYNNIKKNKQTCLKKYGVENAFQNEKIKNKLKTTKLEKYGDENYTNRESYKKTCLNKYGVDNVSKDNKIKIKKINTCLKNWGVEYFLQLDRIKIKLGPEFELYKYNCYSSTLKNKKELFEKWDGYDYYDGEYIKDNMSLYFQDGKYPTIDHKISIYHGYKTKLSIKSISSIDNLCITKRKINSKKNKKNEIDFCYLTPVEPNPPILSDFDN